MNITDELQKLQKLRDIGTLSDDEFTLLKNRLIDSLTKKSSGSFSNSSINNFIHTITRSRTDSWFGGVCGGLAVKTGLPSWVWRLIFTTGFFVYSIGLLIYVMLWVFVPMETMEMKKDLNGEMTIPSQPLNK